MTTQVFVPYKRHKRKRKEKKGTSHFFQLQLGRLFSLVLFAQIYSVHILALLILATPIPFSNLLLHYADILV